MEVREDSPAFVASWLYSMFLPLRYNANDPLMHGALVDMRLFDIVLADIMLKFSGDSEPLALSTPPIYGGNWRNPASGNIVHDLSKKYEIVTDDAEDGWFISKSREYGSDSMFRQDQMFVLKAGISRLRNS